MENVKHIKNITIENFKCFDYLFVEGFSKINIILGDNNVGKTSFLESLLFDENISQTIDIFQGILNFKGVIGDFEAYKIDPFIFYTNKFSSKNYIKINIEYFSGNFFNNKFETVLLNDISIEDKKSFPNFFNTLGQDNSLLKITDKINDVSFRRFETINNLESTDTFISYVFSTAYYSKDLVEFYVKNFADKRNTKNELIVFLKMLIPNISDIEITLNFIDNIPLIGFWLEGENSILPLPMFGDGTIRLFRFIMEIFISKNKFLCIDEVDIGIHYSKYKDFARIILNISHQNNVQLFITTHNNEFLKAFKEVLEEEDFKNYQDETKCFSLKRLPKGEVKAYSYNFEEFEFAIEQENELR